MSRPDPLVNPSDALEELQRSDQRWDAAVHAFDSYEERLRSLADAAEKRSRALTFAHLANITGKPRPGAGGMRKLAFELTEAGGRRGPKTLWRRFDQAVAEIGDALAQGGDYQKIAAAFADLAAVAHELADACTQERESGGQRSRTA